MRKYRLPLIPTAIYTQTSQRDLADQLNDLNSEADGQEGDDN